jgi:phosphoenolpyruvate carboxylase
MDGSAGADAGGQDAARRIETWTAALTRNAYDGADPFANQVQRMSHELSTDLAHDRLTEADVTAVVRELSARAFARNARDLRRLLVDADGKPFAIDDIAHVYGLGPDQTPDFDTARAALERASLGIVFTAHPVFRLNRTARTVLAEAVAAFVRDPEAPLPHELQRAIAGLDLRPDPALDLGMELTEAEDAVAVLHGALRGVLTRLIDDIAARWPERWREIIPRPLTVASWVAYDLDGRTDIAWWDSFRIRLGQKQRQLARYAARLNSIVDTHLADTALATDAQTLARQLENAASTVAADRERFERPLDVPANLAAAANALTAPGAERLTSLANPLAALTAMIDAAPTSAAKALAVLRAEMVTYGLSSAHIHIRINATQLHNAIRRQLNLDGEPDDPGAKRRFLAKLGELLDGVAGAAPQTVNFAALMAERATAPRQFLLIAQIIKHVDADAPIRFLIAECETPFTVLVAIYLARRFGVAHRVDISPLFETAPALERGPQLIDRLLQDQHYRAVVAERGRISIQTGFSDAGRFVGQIPASLAIERLHIKFAEVLERHGLAGTEVLIFSTHGEAMGRGAHPGSLSDRHDHLLTPMAKARLARTGCPLKHEVSYQGADGYLMFTSPGLAAMTLVGLLRHTRAPPATDAGDDPLYRNSEASLDLFLRLKAFHGDCIHDPDYAALLGSFGTSMLHKTGSRVSKRQHDRASAVDRGHPSQMRAIPHNAILQQLGFMANSAGGLGRATAGDVELFGELFATSPRARRLMALADRARSHSSLNVLAAYASVFDPSYWIGRAYNAQDEAMAERCQEIARVLGPGAQSNALGRIVNRFRGDMLDFNRLRAAAGLPGFDNNDAGRLELLALHALRVALIKHLIQLAARVPRFAERHDLTREQVLGWVLTLDVPHALSVLEGAFPVAAPDVGAGDLLEAAGYRPDSHSYRDLHEDLFEPMRSTYDHIRLITCAISAHIGAHG